MDDDTKKGQARESTDAEINDHLRGLDKPEGPAPVPASEEKAEEKVEETTNTSTTRSSETNNGSNPQ